MTLPSHPPHVITPFVLLWEGEFNVEDMLGERPMIVMGLCVCVICICCVPGTSGII